MRSEIALQVIESQTILMKTLAQKSYIEDIVLTKKRISVEFSLLLRKLVWIRNLWFFKRQAETHSAKQIWS